MIKKIYLFIIVMILVLLTLTGCSDTHEEKDINDKTKEEIAYLEKEIFMVVNKYVKDEYIKDNNLNWDSINDDVEEINGALDTIILDLSEVNISNDDLIKLRNEVDNLFIAVGKKDEYNFLNRCGYMYSLLPGYLDKCTDNKNIVNIMKLKSLVLTSFIQSQFNEWEQAKINISTAETHYKGMMDNIDYMKEYSYNLNKVYILLEEFKSSIDNEEADLAQVKYITFIEKSPQI